MRLSSRSPVRVPGSRRVVLRVALAFLALVAAASTAGGCSHLGPASPSADIGGAKVLLPARVRRLTNAEYERTVEALVEGPEPLADRLPPDVRQEGYTPNAGQAVPSAWAARVDAIAREVAHRAVTSRLGQLVACARGEAREPPPRCAAELVDTLGRRAWRRPLDPSEREALLALFAGAAGAGGFPAGAEAVLTALMESPNMLYLTELGARGAPGTVTTLTPYEIASLLSYTLRGGPPDEPLLQAAATRALLGAGAREEQARRLLAMSDTRLHFRRFVLEWLEIDGLPRSAKSAELYPGYEDLKAHMVAETSAFADEVMVYGGGDVRGLLDARFASVDPDMARFYGLKTWGARASLAATRRGGVLQHASFLAAHAHEDGTSPVKRGDFVLRRLLCIRVPRPAEVGIETVFPPPSPDRTTRERFAAHTQSPACRACHKKLDGLGDTFESFDAVGAERSTENGKPVDTRSALDLHGQAVSFADSLELSEWLARDPAVVDCYVRQAFRYFTAQSDPTVESELVSLVAAAPPETRGNLFEALVAYVRSDLFIQREVHP